MPETLVAEGVRYALLERLAQAQDEGEQSWAIRDVETDTPEWLMLAAREADALGQIKLWFNYGWQAYITDSGKAALRARQLQLQENDQQ